MVQQQERLNRRSESLGFSWTTYLITIIVLEVFVLVPLFVLKLAQDNIALVPLIMFAVQCFGSLFYLCVLFSRRLFIRLGLGSIESQQISTNVTTLQETIQEDFFTKLVRINFNYIDKYYLQTQVQADKSFLLCMIAAVTSLVIIAFGIVLMYVGENVTPAYLTAGTGVLGEIVATVFFYLYNRTILEMGGYHQKLVLTQNISLALKIADELPEPHQAEAKINLITSLTKDINMYLSTPSQTELRNKDVNLNSKMS
jgi:hypothetical protein